MKRIIFARNKQEIFNRFGQNASISRVLSSKGSQENCNFVVEFKLWIPK